MKDFKRFISRTFEETVWDRTIDRTTVLQTLIAASKDADSNTTLCYTLPTADTEQH